jgi:LAO/AO transport system kinase
MEAAGAANGITATEADTGLWRPPIHKTVATRREGIAELAEAILAHRAYLEQSGELFWRERERAAAELETIIQQEALRSVLARTDQSRLSALIDQIVRRELDPFGASQRLLGSRGVNPRSRKG